MARSTRLIALGFGAPHRCKYGTIWPRTVHYAVALDGSTYRKLSGAHDPRTCADLDGQAGSSK